MRSARFVRKARHQSRQIVKSSILISAVAFAAACSPGFSPLQITSSSQSKQGQGAPIVVKARAIFKLSMNNQTPGVVSVQGVIAGNPAQVPITVINAPNATMTINTDQFTIPSISNTLLNFGSIAIDALMDNDLRVCGDKGNRKCTQAVIRVYTTGQAGGGLYNSDAGYGIPITSSAATGGDVEVGFEMQNAAVIQAHAIPNNKHVLKLSDFSPAPVFQIKSDFTEAGAGSFSTTLVIEYGLTL